MKDKLQSHGTFGQVRRCLHAAVIFSVLGIVAGFWIGKHQSPTLKDLNQKLLVIKSANQKLDQKIIQLDGEIIEIAQQSAALLANNVDLTNANAALTKENLALRTDNKEIWEDYTSKVTENIAVKSTNMELETKILSMQAEILDCQTNCETICDAQWATKWNSSVAVKARLAELAQFARQQKIADWHRRDKINGNKGVLCLDGQWLNDTLRKSKSWLTFH